MIGRLALIPLLALSVAAVAQDTAEESERKMDRFMAPVSEIGTRFKRAPETAGQAESRDMQKRIAKCVFYRNKDDVRALLAKSDFDWIDFDALGRDAGTFYDEIDFGDCIGSAMKHSTYRMAVRMPYGTLRNLLAEEAYLKDYKQAPTISADSATVIEDRYAFTDGGPRAQSLALVADCLTYRDMAGVHAVLDTRPGSKGEGEAIDALGPTIMVCLEADEMPDIDTSMLRQVIADGAWARAHYTSEAAE